MSSNEQTNIPGRAERWKQTDGRWLTAYTLNGVGSSQDEWFASLAQSKMDFEREEMARGWGQSFKDRLNSGALDYGDVFGTDEERATRSFPLAQFWDEKVKNLCFTLNDPRIACWRTGFELLSKLRTEVTRVKKGDQKHLTSKLGHKPSEQEIHAINEAWRKGAASVDPSSRGPERSFLLFKLAGSTERELTNLRALCEGLMQAHKQREDGDPKNFSALHETLHKVLDEPGIDFEVQDASNMAADITRYLSHDAHEIAPGVLIKPQGEQLLYITRSQSETAAPSELGEGGPFISELHAESARIHEMQGADSAHASELMVSLPTIPRSTEAAQEQATRYAALPHPALPELQAEREPAELGAQGVVVGELEGEMFLDEDLYSGPGESAHDASKKPSRSRLKDALKRAVRKGFGSSSGA